MGVINPCQSICSAFRAGRITPFNQFVEADTQTVVSFDNEIFDLNDEYNPVTSTFTATEAGVYSFSFTVRFDAGDNHIVDFYIVVNNSIENPQTSRLADVATISFQTYHLSTTVLLQPNDTVHIQVRSSESGNLIGDSTERHFEGARFPSLIDLP